MKKVADKEFFSLEKLGIYELVPISFVTSSQKTVYSRSMNKIKVDGTFKCYLVVQRRSQVPCIDYGAILLPSVGCKVLAR